MGIFDKLFSGKAENFKGIDASKCKNYRYKSLATATNNFHDSNKLGEGGFGTVYEGKLKDGREIAVKKLSEKSKQGTEEFITEANLLSRLQHRNVVKLYGYCAHNNEKLLVYERLPNKSLDKLLSKPSGRMQLNWPRRYEIITGIGRGLLYLHQGSHDCIIHRDIKLSNILIDGEWRPKICDFGMSRILLPNRTHVITQRVAGTLGYVAPEYWKDLYLTVKADIYSYGVLLLEIVSGRKITEVNLPDGAENLLDWAYKCYQKKRSLEFMDPILEDSVVSEQVENCIEIGLRCVQGDPKSRPTMEEVVSMSTGNKGHAKIQIQRPFYDDGASEPINVASGLQLELEKAAPIQGYEFEADEHQSECIPDHELVDEHQSECIPDHKLVDEHQSECIPDHKLVDEHQSECIPTNSNQIMEVDPHSNSFTFPVLVANVGLSIPTTNNHLSSSLEPSADEEGKVPDTTSSELSMDPSQAERKESRTEELSNLHGSVTSDTERDEYIFAEFISKLGAEMEVDATNTESEEERKAVAREFSQTVAFLREIELTQKMLQKDLENISTLELGERIQQCIKQIGKYENGTKLMAITRLQNLNARLERALNEYTYIDTRQDCMARLAKYFRMIQEMDTDVEDYVEPVDGPSQDIPNSPDRCHGPAEDENWNKQYNSLVQKECQEEKRKYKKRERGKVPSVGLNNSAKKGSGFYSHQESLKQNTALYAVKRVQELMDKHDNEMSSSFGGLKVLAKEFKKGKWQIGSADGVELEKKGLAKVEPRMDARLQEIKLGMISYLDNYISSLRKWAKGIEILEDLDDLTGGITESQKPKHSCCQQVCTQPQYPKDDRFFKCGVS